MALVRVPMSRSVEAGFLKTAIACGPVFPTWILLYGWSLWRIPVPGVNEPHYLSKSRHFWMPEWCPGDFFLESSNTHLVFYSTFGWLTTLCTLPAAAIIGRGIGLLIVAWGWQQLSTAVTGRKWCGLLAVPLLLMLQSLGNFSGEWLIGGIEAKVPAYGFLFWSLGQFLTGRFYASAVLAGLSVSLHPLVGLWGAIAALLAVLANEFRARTTLRAHPQMSQQTSLPGAIPQPAADNVIQTAVTQTAPAPLRTPSPVTLLRMFILFVLTALPGMVPAWQVVQASDLKMELVANQLQVADRLAHHLDPMRFPKEAYRYWGMMIVLWLMLQARLPRTPENRWWRDFVLATILIALAGIVIGLGPRPIAQMPGYAWRLKLLKFYFFRLGDQMVPVALCLAATQFGLAWKEQVTSRAARPAALLISLTAIVLGALFIPFPDAHPSRMNPAKMQDWKTACRWIRTHSKPSDLMYVADTGWAAKWFAQRPEYVSFKDMPQDAASIIEWNHRLWNIARWRRAAMADSQVTPEELIDLRTQTGIRYFVCSRFGPLLSEPVYANSTFRVYDLSEPSSAKAADVPTP